MILHCYFYLTPCHLQAIRVELVQYLVSLLEAVLHDVKNPAGCKAQIVKALKSMTRDLAHGGEVRPS